MESVKSIESKPKKKVIEFSIVRIIATFLVVVAHSVYLASSTQLGGINYDFVYNQNWFIKVYNNLTLYVAQFLMPLFFIASGAIYKLSEKKSLDELVSKKFKRLIIPFLLCGILFMLPVRLLGNFYKIGNFNEVIRGFLNGTETCHLWFLPTLFWTTIIFYLLLKVFKNKSDAALLIVSLIIQKYYSYYIHIDVFFLSLSTQYIFWYALGYVFCKHKDSYKITNKQNIMWTIVLCIISIIDFKYKILNSYGVIIVNSFLIYSVSKLLANTKIGKSKVIEFLDKYILYIYLFHDPLEYLVLRVTFKFNLLTSNINILIYILSRTIGVIIVSLIIAVIVDKIKKLVNSKLTSCNS